jgi:shikimate dehydrogenase
MMHQAALSEARLSGYYLPLKVDQRELKTALDGLLALGFGGLNVTAPHKEAVIPHLFSLSPAARIIGAVNTLKATAQGYEGHNTDAPGFAAAYLKSLSPGQKAVLYGAGGAARAVIQAFKSQDLEILVTARNFEAAGKLAAEFQQKAVPLAEIEAHSPYSIAVNATSASYAADLDPAPDIPLTSGGLVIDLNYGRPDNYWSQLAAKNGGRFFDGLPMLAQQARLSFNIWTRAEVSLKPFSQALSVYMEKGLNNK